MATVKLYLHRAKVNGQLRKDEAPINLMFTDRTTRVLVSTGERIPPKYWDKRAQEVKSNYRGHIEINAALQTLKQSVIQIWRENRGAEPEKIKGLVRLVVRGEDQPASQKKTSSLTQFVNDYIERCRKFKLKKGPTINTYSQTLELLIEYAGINGIELTFEAITMEFYYGFTTFLWDDKAHNDNTVGKHIKNLKTFMQESFEDDLHQNISFKKKKFKKPGFKADNVYLTSDEILRVYGLDLRHNPLMAIHRDLFVFNCWVGLRYGDLCRIQPEQVRQMSEGKYLQIITEKTGEDVTIPFHPLAEAIYSYYNKKLPALTKDESVVYNRHLKTICELAKINTVSRHVTSVRGVSKTTYYKKYEMVSAHTARRSFATNCYKMDVKVMDIMAVTGHKTEKAFLRYICVTKEEHAKQMMDKFNKTAMSGVMRIAN